MTLKQLVADIIEGDGYDALYVLYDDPTVDVTREKLEEGLVKLQLEVSYALEQLRGGDFDDKG